MKLKKVIINTRIVNNQISFKTLISNAKIIININKPKFMISKNQNNRDDITIDNTQIEMDMDTGAMRPN